MNPKNFFLLLILMFCYFLYCGFYQKNLPIGAPGIGVKKENSKFIIHFNVGIFTFLDLEITREEVEFLLQESIKEIQKEYDFLVLKPIVDQPLDSVFVIEKSTKKKINPLIQKYPLNAEWESINSLIVKNVSNDQKYFILSELENFFYNQVRYDLILLPLPLINNTNIEKENLILEMQYYISKGRKSLDKMSFSVSLDYKNIKKNPSIRKLKKILLSFIFYLHPDLIDELPENPNYPYIRKQILDLYERYNSGKKIKCQEVDAIQEKLNQNFIYLKNSKFFRVPLELNLNFLKKKCI